LDVAAKRYLSSDAFMTLVGMALARSMAFAAAWCEGRDDKFPNPTERPSF
jgi:hypothetical protein